MSDQNLPLQTSMSFAACAQRPFLFLGIKHTSVNQEGAGSVDDVLLIGNMTWYEDNLNQIVQYPKTIGIRSNATVNIYEC